MNYDARLAGMGRDELIAEVRRLADESERVRRERDELLLEVRTLRRFGEADRLGAGGSS